MRSEGSDILSGDGEADSAAIPHPLMVIVSDIRGKVAGCNNHACRILGYSEEEIMSKTFDNLLMLKNYDALSRKIHTESEISNQNIGLIDHGGTACMTLASASLLRNADSRPFGIVWLASPLVSLTGAAEEKADDPDRVYPSVFDSASRRCLIDLASEVIISTDIKGTIVAWNTAAEQLTGFPRRKMILKNIFEDDMPKGLIPLFNHLRESIQEKNMSSQEYEIKNRSGVAVRFFIRSSILAPEGRDLGGAILIGNDVSREAGGAKLMPGLSYLVFDAEPEKLICSLSYLKRRQYDTLLLTRRMLPCIKKPEDPEIVLYSGRQGSSYACETLPEKIIALVNEYAAKHCKVLIIADRLDYIYLNHGFACMMKFIYSINDLIRSTDHIALLNIQKKLLDESQMIYLKEELADLPILGDSDMLIDDKKREILKFISDRNLMRSAVNYTRIGYEIQISRMTAYRWLGELQESGLIKSMKCGRNNNLFVTAKGMQYLERSDKANMAV